MEIDCFIPLKKEPKKKYDNSVLNPALKKNCRFGSTDGSFQSVGGLFLFNIGGITFTEQFILEIIGVVWVGKGANLDITREAFADKNRIAFVL